MSEDNAVAIILGVLSSNLLVEFGRYLIGKFSSSKKLDERFKALDERFDKITSRFDKQEKDIVRLQLMVLMSDYPEKKDEIMEVAKHYFYDLKGNWYMTPIYKEWLKKEDIEQPNWLK